MKSIEGTPIPIGCGRTRWAGDLIDYAGFAIQQTFEFKRPNGEPMRLTCDPTVEARARVVAAARGWIGTPFHHAAQVKGAGCDCVNLVAAAYEEAGVTGHVDIAPYSQQIMLHRGEETVIGYLLRYGREIAEADARAGDVVLYKVGRSYSHAGIIVEWPRAIIHAHSSSRKVIEMEGRSADLSGRPTRFFTPW